ncbi:DUF3336 domain-containing protein [Deltaproteobacteria bacterium TL4]
MIKRAAEECRTRMNTATDFYTWYTAAVELDWIEDHEDWKNTPESSSYMYLLIQERLDKLKECYRKKDITQLTYQLREGLKRNLGNLANTKLYHKTHVGTKYLIDDYVTEVSSLLKYLYDLDDELFPFEEKLKFFKHTGQSFGRSALLLSGGAAMGMFHIGVCKALWEQHLLPRVISGASAGSVMASVLGSHTDAELDELFQEPEKLYLDAFKLLNWKEMLTQKSVLSSHHLESCLRYNIGEYTFEEGFDRSKRIVNISLSPMEENQNTRLASFLTTPHIMIWSAALASCAVPTVFEPVELAAKDVQGNMVAYMPNVKWVDGSIFQDLPMQRLSELYNVNHYIVSQTNPHVIPFIEKRRMTRRSFNQRLLYAARILLKAEAKHRGRQLLHLMHDEGGSDIMGAPIVSSIQAMVKQRYYGDITIAPNVNFRKYLKIFSNPSQEELKAAILEGERAAWHYITAIRNQTLISQTLENCVQKLKKRRFEMCQAYSENNK